MSKRFWLLLITCLLAEQVGCKVSMGRGRSSARASSSSSRGSSYGRNTGGMGGIAQNRNTGSGYSNSGNYRGTNMATGGFNRNSGGGFNNRNSGDGFASSGGFNNRNHGYSKGTGIGSALRSSTFKNMLVGAAAGYLTYQAGKFLIRSAMAPMMWNNRPYYWGQNYYQPRPNTQMCRMPVDPSDPQLGNVYFQDNQRPREIVWGCGYNEYCCGYECCPGTMGMGGASMGGGSMGAGGYPMNTGGLPAAGAIAGAGASESALSHGLSVRPSQSVGVRGQLKCNGMPAAGVLVKLYDHDTFTLDDKIASGRTDALGNFLLAGHEHEFTRVTPKLNIYHDCNDWLPCQRKISIYVPKEFVSQGEVARQIYDVGIMELAGSFEGESRDCFH